MRKDGLLVVLETATKTPTVALARRDGSLVAERQWESVHRHGEQLLQMLDDLLGEAGIELRELGGVIVGIGPGSFTGLRIGLATAKTMAYNLEIPLVGVSTTRGLALAAVGGGEAPQVAPIEVAVSLPAGVADRYVHRLRFDGLTVEEVAPPQLVATDSAIAEAAVDALLVAVDLSTTDLPAEAIEGGTRAVAGLAAALARIGTGAMAAGETDDVARLVPAYVALPRGIAQAAEQIEWSPDLR